MDENMKGAGDGQKEKDEKKRQSDCLRRTCHQKIDEEVVCRK